MRKKVLDYLQNFLMRYKDHIADDDVFIPMEFNPSTDWCGGKGTWYMRDIPCIDLELAEAIWQRLSALEGERKRKAVSAE